MAARDAQVRAEDVRAQLEECLADLQAVAELGPGDVLVVGASTSEVAGERIGTAGSVELGRTIAMTVLDFTARCGCDAAFQCCEHLNRALVVPRRVARERGLREVSAVPVPGAGGAVAAWAYALLEDACLVEGMKAEAGIDIGDTLIGMHLRSVAVPVRGRRTEVGRAHVVMARTRPPLIGGVRAVYDKEELRRRLGL